MIAEESLPVQQAKAPLIYLGIGFLFLCTNLSLVLFFSPSSVFSFCWVALLGLLLCFIFVERGWISSLLTLLLLGLFDSGGEFWKLGLSSSLALTLWIIGCGWKELSFSIQAIRREKEEEVALLKEQLRESRLTLMQKEVVLTEQEVFLHEKETNLKELSHRVEVLQKEVEKETQEKLLWADRERKWEETSNSIKENAQKQKLQLEKEIEREREKRIYLEREQVKDQEEIGKMKTKERALVAQYDQILQQEEGKNALLDRVNQELELVQEAVKSYKQKEEKLLLSYRESEKKSREMEDLYRQLKTQIEEKSELLHQSRSELFLLSEKLLSFQREQEESLLTFPQESEDSLNAFCALESQLCFKEQEAECLEEIISFLVQKESRKKSKAKVDLSCEIDFKNL